MADDKALSFSDEKKYKFILVGDSNVGKTALFWRFT
jgi:GTPase SAR1 family protein